VTEKEGKRVNYRRDRERMSEKQSGEGSTLGTKVKPFA